MRDFRDYLETVEGTRHLGEMINHFPPPLFSLDFRHLRDAVIVEPTPEDPAAPNTRAYDLFLDATEYRGLTHTSFPHFTRAILDGIHEGRLDSEHVIERAFLERIGDDHERMALWTSMPDWVRVYDGVVPTSLHIIDGRVLVWLGETRDVTAGLLESENAAVLSWAESLYDSYRAEAEPISAL